MPKDTMQFALQVAKAIPYEKGRKRVAAVITDKRGKVLSVGINDYTKSHPRQKALSVKVGLDEERCYIHAELAAILKMPRTKGQKQYKMTIARVDSKGNDQLAMPCPSCMQAIREFGQIQSLEWTR